MEMCLAKIHRVYTKMDEETRRRYRQQVCRLAKRLGMTEAEAAQKALDLAEKGRGRSKHVGFYLFPSRWAGKSARNRGALYLTLLVLLPLWGSLF